MLFKQSYLEKHLLQKIKSATGEKTKAHTLFRLMVPNDGHLLIKMYTKLDITFVGLKGLDVGVLIVGDPTQVLDRKHQSKLPGIVGWNLIWLSYNAFVEKHKTSGFDFFTCLKGVNPLLFSQLCVCYHSDICKGHTLGVATKVVSHQPQQIEPPKTDDLAKKTNGILLIKPDK